MVYLDMLSYTDLVAIYSWTFISRKWENKILQFNMCVCSVKTAFFFTDQYKDSKGDFFPFLRN